MNACLILLIKVKPQNDRSQLYSRKKALVLAPAKLLVSFVLAKTFSVAIKEFQISRKEFGGNQGQRV